MATVNEDEYVKRWSDRWLNILYGSIVHSEAGNCDGFVDLCVEYFESCLTFCGFLAGFEFIGLSGLTVKDDYTKAAVFVLVLAFVFALTGSIISLIQLGWIRFYKGHSLKTIKDALNKYVYFMDAAQPFCITSIVLFSIAVNILVWSIFEDDQDDIYPLIINIVSGIVYVPCVYMSIKFHILVVKPWVQINQQ